MAKRTIIEVNRGLMSRPRIREEVVAELALQPTVVDAAAAAVDANPTIADHETRITSLTPTTRSFSARGGTTSAYLAPSAYAIPQDFGGIGDGLSDDTTALQSLLTAMGTAPNAAGMVTPGEWTFLSPLTAAANSTIVGERGRSKLVMAPDAGWSGTGSRAAIEIIGADNVTLRDLIIDGQGASRAGARAMGQHILVNNSRGGRIENVTFRGGGYIGGSPTGPYLAFVAADALSDWGDYASLAVGPVDDWTVRGCTFEQAAGGGFYFAVRILTNFLLERPTASFTHYARGIRLERNRFLANASGEGFDWNSIELAGGGTIFNEIAFNHFWGRTLSHVDFDKGCSFNTAHHNTIHSAGKSTSQVGVTSNKLAVLNDHGMSATYMNVGNTFHHNRIHDAVNLAETEAYPAGINIQHADGHTSERNTIRNVQNGTKGAAIFLDDNTPNCTIEGNRASTVKVGALTKGTATTRTNLRIRRNEIDAADQAISVAGVVGTTPTGGQITHNTLKTASTTLQCLNLGPELTAPIVEGNTTQGGETGLYLNSPDAVVAGNVSRGATRGIRAVASGLRLTGNDSLGTTSQILYGAGVTTTEVNNSWQRRVLSGPAAPTAGTWTQGDTVYNTAPAAGGVLGWVCVSGGTPGTWKTFGGISA